MGQVEKAIIQSGLKFKQKPALSETHNTIERKNNHKKKKGEKKMAKYRIVVSTAITDVTINAPSIKKAVEIACEEHYSKDCEVGEVYLIDKKGRQHFKEA